VRELVNALERATILRPSGTIDDELVLGAGRAPRPATPESSALLPTLAELETDYFRRVLERTEGRIYGPGGAAEIAGMKPTTLQSRLQKRGIDRKAVARGERGR
jgi:DNA-binding NtrC family response regulator